MLLLKVFQKKKKKEEDIRRATSICGVLIYILIFQNFLVIVSVGTYIRRVLVFDGYLYSRVYGM